MSDLRLSFIVPVYNVEKYLGECIESVVNQWEASCEMILVNDGSTDGSGALCDEYANRYEGVRVIHQENKGLSGARNTGLDAAKGQYIAFLDSDDRIAAGRIPHLLAWIDGDGADVCFLDAIKFYPNGEQEPLGDAISRETVRGRSAEEVFAHLATRPKYPGSACTKLFRRAFFEENNIRFPSDRRLSEDLGFCLNCFLLAQSFDALEGDYYEYRQSRSGSITNIVSKRNFDDLGRFVSESTDKLTVNKAPADGISRYAMSFVAYEYSIMLWQYSQLDKTCRKEAKTFLESYRWVLDYGVTPKTVMIRRLAKTVGVGMVSRLLGGYMTYRQKRRIK